MSFPFIFALNGFIRYQERKRELLIARGSQNRVERGKSLVWNKPWQANSKLPILIFLSENLVELVQLAIVNSCFEDTTS